MCFRKEILPLLELESFDMPHSQEMKIKAVLNPSIRYGEIHIGYEPRTGDSKLFPLKHGIMMLWVGLSLRIRLAKATSNYHARRRVAAKKV